MKTEAGNPTEHTILIVADDFDILVVAQAVLTGKGYRVLAAGNAKHAIQLLKAKHIPVHSVAIWSGVAGHEKVRDWSLRRGAMPWFFHSTQHDESIVLKGLDSGADFEKAVQKVSLQRSVQVQ